jgi:hypothetical protein
MSWLKNCTSGFFFFKNGFFTQNTNPFFPPRLVVASSTRTRSFLAGNDIQCTVICSTLLFRGLISIHLLGESGRCYDRNLCDFCHFSAKKLFGVFFEQQYYDIIFYENTQYVCSFKKNSIFRQFFCRKLKKKIKSIPGFRHAMDLL